MTKPIAPPGCCPTCRAPLDEFGCRIIKELDVTDQPLMTQAVISECANPKYADH